MIGNILCFFMCKMKKTFLFQKFIDFNMIVIYYYKASLRKGSNNKAEKRNKKSY